MTNSLNGQLDVWGVTYIYIYNIFNIHIYISDSAISCKCYFNEPSCANFKIEKFTNLSVPDQELFNIRSECMLSEDSYVCVNHKKKILSNYSQYYKNCINPLKCHLNVITKKIRVVSLDDYKFYLNKFNIVIKPGQKICTNCSQVLKNMTFEEFLKTRNRNSNRSNNEESAAQESEPEESSPPEESPPEESSPSCTPKEFTLDHCNLLLNNMNISPIKLKGGHMSSRISYAKKKLNQINNVFDQPLKKILDLPNDVVITNLEKDESLRKIELYDSIINGLKDKYQKSNKNEKIQCLTLVTDEMTYAEVKNNFNASQRLIIQSKVVRDTNGVLAIPGPKKGKPLTQEILDKVYNFYCDDLYSRLMPGKKDYVRVGKNLVQKRLILCTLHELYAEYKKIYPSDKIGYSKFCTLRPKHCILADANGTHSVCVCCIHQNFNLLLRATGTSISYKNFISKIVCNIENKECMYGLCKSCPNEETIEEHINSLFPESNEDEDFEDEFEFNEWTSTDRAELITKRCYKSELIEFIKEKISKLLPHVYVSKEQSNYFKSKKMNLKANEALVVLDFSENYKYVIQDDIQARFYFQEAVTIHPVVIYIKSGNETTNVNLCFMSEDLRHDVPMVKVFIDKILSFIKQNYPGIEDVEFFSDGCGAQYKNAEIFAYLPECQNKFKISLSWNFFATSHGKTSCDGLGGCIKRQAALESLRRPYADQIINIERLLNFCKENIKDITCHLVTIEEIENIRVSYNKVAKTIPGTRQFHQFVPHKNIIKCKHTSTDESCALLFNLNGKKLKSFSLNKIVAFIFNNSWYLGKLISNQEEELESKINKMSYCNKMKSYSFPENIITLTVPYPHILCTINFKILKKQNKEIYNLPKAQLTKIERHYNKYQQNTLT